MVGDIIMRLDWHDSENEEKTMREYFLNCEFDTVAEVHEFYDSSAFLKTHPELKNEVVGIALQGLKDSQEWAEKHIVIRKGKSVKAIEKGQEIPPGWEIK
jgi:hypothetical protein